jgi:hypothetical protein
MNFLHLEEIGQALAYANRRMRQHASAAMGAPWCCMIAIIRLSDLRSAE